MARKPFMILFASQKGGVGKTTISLNLAVALTYQKYQVLLVDSDLESASASEQLGIKTDGKGYVEAIKGNAKIEETIFAYEPIDLYVLPGSPANDAIPPKPSDVAEFYSQLKKLDYDFIIVDSPPGLFNAEIARYFDEVVILTMPDPVSAEANSRMAEYCKRFKLEHRLLINRGGYSKYDLDKEEVERLFGDVAFQVIPEDKIVEESVMKHKPAYMIDRRSSFSLAIDELVRVYMLKTSAPSEGHETEFERKTPTTFFEKLGKWVMGGK